MNKTMKQTIKVTFWAQSEDVANEAYDYIFDNFIDCDEELECEGWKETDEGGYLEFTYECTLSCPYYEMSSCERAYTDITGFIDEDEPKDWLEKFAEGKGEDYIDEIYCTEKIEEVWD